MILARALYSNADIYLFDDPLSAVDAKVAKSLFWECIKPLSKSKTVLLVSHQLAFIKECDEVLLIEDGRIKKGGTSEELKKELYDLNEMISQNEE